MNLLGFQRAFDSKLHVLTQTTNFIFGFSCHFGLASIYGALREQSLDAYLRVNRLGTLLLGFFSLVVMVGGYLSAPVNTPDLIIYREAQGRDLAMTIGKVALLVSLSFSAAPNYNFFRLAFFCLVKDSERFSFLE